jgi:predicted nicotinamide N-methyase
VAQASTRASSQREVRFSCACGASLRAWARAHGYGELHGWLFGFARLVGQGLTSPGHAFSRFARHLTPDTWPELYVSNAVPWIPSAQVGCGTGAVGLSCAAIGAAEVVLTDLDEDVLALAQRCAALNELNNVRTVQLDLEQPTVEQLDALTSSPTPTSLSHSPTMLAMAEQAGERATHAAPTTAVGFDYVIASDIIYDFTTPERVAATLEQLLAARPGSRALIVHDQNRCRSDQAQRKVAAFATAVASHTRLQCLHNQSMAALPDGRGLIIDETEPTPLLVQLFCQ